MNEQLDSKNVSPSILQQLKTATSAQHRRVEQRFSILDPSLTLDQYQTWLMKLYGFYKPFEQSLATWMKANSVSCLSKPKTPLLIHDLSILGVAGDEIKALPVCSQFPVIKDVGCLYGALYVMEGATLGGAFIASHLVKILNLKELAAVSFFLPYGPDPKPHWEAFQKQIIEITVQTNIDNIISTASETFDSFGYWLGNEIPLPMRKN